jgi:hypothetical protein
MGEGYMFHVKQRYKIKKIIVATFFLFFAFTIKIFGQTESTSRVFEYSTKDNRVEIGPAFQKRLHNAALGFKEFTYFEKRFDAENGLNTLEELFNVKNRLLLDKKEEEAINNSLSFIFQASSNQSSNQYIALVLVLVRSNIMIAFIFRDVILDGIPCSTEKIDEILASFLEP